MPYNERSHVLCNESKYSILFVYIFYHFSADELHYILECLVLLNIRKEYTYNVDNTQDLMSLNFRKACQEVISKLF